MLNLILIILFFNSFINEKTENIKQNIFKSEFSMNDRMIVDKEFVDNKFEIQQSESVLVYSSDKKENWGYVQFPKIFRTNNNTICITWNLAEDNIKSSSKIGWKYSKDNGDTWNFNWKNRPISSVTILENGDEVKFVSTKIKASELNLPKTNLTYIKPTTKQLYKFYKSSELSSELNTYKLARRSNSKNNFVTEDVTFNNSFGYSYVLDGIFHKQAWGKIIQLKNKELLKANYPFYLLEKGKIGLSSIGIYSSVDNGRNWFLKSYVTLNKEYIRNNSIGLTEPDLVEANDGSILLIARSSTSFEKSPMFSYKSYDNGKTFIDETKVSEYGVLPQLLKLKNGVLVLSSGRPGVQLRFSRNNGNSWSKPIELIKSSKFSGINSCGYTGLLELSESEFLITYSDFTYLNKDNVHRKAIFVKKIKVN